MIHKVQQFFNDIAEKDQETKKLWLIILTSISMIIVISLWGFYIDLTIEDLNSEEQLVEKSNFFSILKSGTVIVVKGGGLKVSQLTASVKSLITKSNSIVIELPEEREVLIADGVKEIILE